MYAWIWRHLPGPVVLRCVLVVLLVSALVALLFGVVFPWIDLVLGVDGSTLGSG